MRILGISPYHDDCAAVLLDAGRIVAAGQEERFTRAKRESRFPSRAIEFCLAQAGSSGVDIVAVHGRNTAGDGQRQDGSRGRASGELLPVEEVPPTARGFEAANEQPHIQALRSQLGDFGEKAHILCVDHHLAHAASAFYPSPFDESVVCVMDGIGAKAATSVGIGRGPALKIVKEILFPHSLGLLYSAFTFHAGFRPNSGEYKVMGLAPYGEPRYVDAIFKHLVDFRADGSFRLDTRHFDIDGGKVSTRSSFGAIFGGPPRQSGDLLERRHMDLAASIQKATELILLTLTRSIAAETQSRNLCLAGDVALNCVANGKVLRDGRFDGLWIQPAAGDAGGALGAALAVHHQYRDQPRRANGRDSMQGAYLGPEFAQNDIEHRLNAIGAQFEVLEDDAVIEAAATALADGKAVGWHQGRMEFGPRALGNRSVLGDPRSPSMQKVLNLKVKYRESFRPFAPSVLREDVADWFEIDTDSPYMLLVADVAEKRRRDMTDEERALFGIEKLNVVRSEIPAVTHVDYSARIQTVHKDTNPRYHALISRFKEKTGCPVVVNTSFNVRGEPIVCTPEDAFHCFMGTELDVLVVGNCFLLKEAQDQALGNSYKDAFELD